MTEQLTLADALKEQGLAQVDSNASDWWKQCADQGIRHLASTGQVFQCADLIDLGVPEPHHPNAWGARMNAAAKAGLIVPAGWGASKRPTVAKSAVRLWRGAA
jgi:hypothetical protein